MVLVLAFVIACIYALVFFLKKTGKKISNDDPYLKQAASITVAPGKTVQVVTIGQKAFLIGVSDASINLIGEIDDEDLINSMNLLSSSEPEGKPKDFASWLSKFSPTTQSASEQLKKQQNRLKNLSSSREDYIK